MLKKFAAALVATALIAVPAFAQSNSAATPNAPAAQTMPNAPAGSTVAAKPAVKSPKPADQSVKPSVKHARKHHAKHVRKHSTRSKTHARMHQARHMKSGKARAAGAVNSGKQS